MTVDTLRKILHEEVRKAIREELGNMLSEMNSTKHYSTSKIENRQVEKSVDGNGDLFNLESILKETRESMTRDDYRKIMGEGVYCNSVISTHNIQTPVDELPSFVKNAKAIYEASITKDRVKHGI